MKKYKKSKRYQYYRKQRIYGLILVGLAIISSVILNGDITMGIILGLLGLYISFTKTMVITDDYFYEVEAKKFDKWREP